MRRFEEFRAEIPEELFAKEEERWGDGIPGFGYDQIEEYLDKQIPKLDKKYSFLKKK